MVVWCEVLPLDVARLKEARCDSQCYLCILSFIGETSTYVPATVFGPLAQYSVRVSRTGLATGAVKPRAANCAMVKRAERLGACMSNASSVTVWDDGGIVVS